MKIRLLLAAIALSFLSVAASRAHDSVGSGNALPLVKLDLDVENNPGWQAIIKGGYEWKLFRNVGYSVLSNGTSHTQTSSHTRSGIAGTLGLAYNFGDTAPLTFGLGLGMGPGAKLNTRSTFNDGFSDVSVFTRQKINLYTLDMSLDYEFKRGETWNPFIGLIGGVAFTSNRGRIDISNGFTTRHGGFDRARNINFLGGISTGFKWRIDQKISFSLYGSYEYIGNIKSRAFYLDGSGFEARSTRAKAHQIGIKAGLRIRF